jgi:propanediol dehydratase small subunit
MEGVFNPEKMAQTVFNLAKDYTTANVQVMKTTMEQFEKTANVLTKQVIVAQDEGTKLWADWFNRAKQSQQQYVNMMEEGLNKMETYFNPDGQKRATK